MSLIEHVQAALTDRPAHSVHIGAPREHTSGGLTVPLVKAVDMTRRPAALDSPHAGARVAVAALSQMMLGEQSLMQMLQQVVNSAKQALPDVKEASVTLLDGQQANTAAFSGRPALQLDERQYKYGFGPCLDAATTGQTVTIMTRGNNPYPEFSRLALKYHIAYVVSIPLRVPDRVLGVLNLYLGQEWPLHLDFTTAAETFAGYAAAQLANAALHQDVVDLSRQLSAALASRSLIEQAKGILMAQHRCSSDAAFDMLVQVARQRHLKVLDTAAAITAEVERA